MLRHFLKSVTLMKLLFVPLLKIKHRLFITLILQALGARSRASQQLSTLVLPSKTFVMILSLSSFLAWWHKLMLHTSAIMLVFISRCCLCSWWAPVVQSMWMRKMNAQDYTKKIKDFCQNHNLVSLACLQFEELTFKWYPYLHHIW